MIKKETSVKMSRQETQNGRAILWGFFLYILSCRLSNGKKSGCWLQLLRT